MSTPQSGESGQSATGASSRAKKISWAVLFVATLLFLGGYIGVIAYARFGGGAGKDFCGQALIGKSPAEAKELAARSGLEVIEHEGLVRVTTNPHMSRHTCDLKIDAGKVKSARVFFRF